MTKKERFLAFARFEPVDLVPRRATYVDDLRDRMTRVLGQAPDIYFDMDTKRQVVSRLLPLLRPGGHLFIGHSESLNGIADNLHPGSRRPQGFQERPAAPPFLAKATQSSPNDLDVRPRGN